MRQREIFVITAAFLGFLLWTVQLVPINYRYLAILGFSLVTYFTCAFNLRKYAKAQHWLTLFPLPALYSLCIGAFYFLLPTNFWSMFIILLLFSTGMYALLLSGNIFVVAQHNKVIQLVHAAQNIYLFAAIIVSLLGVQVIVSFGWPFYLASLAIFCLHLLLSLDIAWSVHLNEHLSLELWELSLFSTLIITEIATTLLFLPLAAWHIALLIMSTFYLILGIMQVFISGKLYYQALNEYVALAICILIMFIGFFPGK